jgi:flagellar motor switch protein FliN/FliY
MSDDPAPGAASADAVSSKPTTTEAALDAASAALLAEAAAGAAPGTADPFASLGGASDAMSNVDADLASAQASIDELLKQANFEDPSAIPGGMDFGGEAPGPPTQPFELPNFQQAMQDGQVSSVDLLRDVELNVKIELGRSRMLVEDVLKLNEGSVVELDKLAGDPVDVFVNDRLVARGEVLVLNDNFCVRVNEIIAGAKEEGL